MTETITVLGAGYVGLTTAALLSNAGYTVYVVEPNPTRLAAIKEGRSFFFEAGLNPIIAHGVTSGTLIPTDSYADSVPLSEIVFSCVGTPDNPDGSSNLEYVFSAATEAAQLMKPGTIYVQKSTVPVGTGEKIIDAFSEKGLDVAYASNPEFLRESTALLDTLWFDRIVVGTGRTDTAEVLFELYRQLDQRRDEIAARASINQPKNTAEGVYIHTTLPSAELIKVTANAFLALKISFANSIAKLSDRVGADINEVMDAVGADKRIGKAFLQAGRGYGGGCFPKDVSGLIASGLEHGVSLDIMQAAQSVNSSMPAYVIEKLQEAVQGDLSGKKVAVLGLAFKSGTSDVRKSPGIAIANMLSKFGATVTTYDPQAASEAAHELREGIVQHDSVEAAASGVDAVIIATNWPELLEYSPATLAESMAGSIFVDAVNSFSRISVESHKLIYIGIGK